MEDNFSPAQLMERALDVLKNNYDPKSDSFFIVVTKNGKDQLTAFGGEQAVIGELNLKSVSAFIAQAVTTLCTSLEIHPFMFISRHITSHFIDGERAVLNQIISARAKQEGTPREHDQELVKKLTETAEEEERDIIVVSSSSMDIEN